MNNRAPVCGGLLLSAVLMFMLFSSIGIVVPIIVIPCGMFAFVAVFAYSGYASLRGKNQNGKLDLPQSQFVDAIMSLWIFCATIAIAVGIPMLIYLSWIMQNHTW